MLEPQSVLGRLFALSETYHRSQDHTQGRESLRISASKMEKDYTFHKPCWFFLETKNGLKVKPLTCILGVNCADKARSLDRAG